MRLCLQAGYHRDPGNNAAISAFESEMRRRVWMFAIEYDATTAYQLGITRISNDKICDTALPSNYLDSDFSEEFMPTPRPETEMTPMLPALCYTNLATIFGKITLLSHELRFPSKAEIETLRAELDDARNRLPAQLKMIPIDQSFVDPPGLMLDRLRMELMYQRSLCILYRSFLAQAGYETERQYCLGAAEELVRQTIPLVEVSQPGGLLGSTGAVFVRRHVHDFNLAAMLLCSEIKKQSTRGSDELSARLKPVLLQACTLWNFSGVASPKARHAIRAVERFLLQDPYTTDMATEMTAVPPTESGMGVFDPSMSSDVPLIGPEAMGFVNNALPAFSLAHDPMFQDLFSYDAFQTAWPMESFAQ